MIWGRELRGLLVYEIKAKTLLGRAVDVWVDWSTGSVKGIIVEGKSLFARYYLLPIGAIASLSKAGIMIADRKKMQSLPKTVRGINELRMSGISLIDHHGIDRGIVADYLIDNNRVAGWEVSQGIISDYRQGRKFVRWDSTEQTQELAVASLPQLEEMEIRR